MKKYSGNRLIALGLMGVYTCLTLIGIWIFLSLFLSLFISTRPPWWMQVRWDRLYPVFGFLAISVVLLVIGKWQNDTE